jgi:hypothetical protein
MRMMKMLSSPTQLIDFASRHFSCIDESVYADIRELPYSMGHAPAQGLLEPIVTAIALIVHETILLLTLSNGARHSWKQKEAEAGNRSTDSRTPFGPHSINSIWQRTHGFRWQLAFLVANDGRGSLRPNRTPVMESAETLASDMQSA